MAHTAIDHGYSPSTSGRNNRSITPVIKSLFSKLWTAFSEYQKARADKEILSALKHYDDAYLRSIGLERSEITSLRNRM